jgi:hypothetical protein
MSELIKIILIVVLVILLLIFGPIATIWALNTLFPVLAIPYTFDTWCAIVLVGAFLRANVTVKK